MKNLSGFNFNSVITGATVLAVNQAIAVSKMIVIAMLLLIEAVVMCTYYTRVPIIFCHH